MDAQAPFVDPAAPLLAASPEIDDAKRADLWDVFHNAKDPNELAQQLQKVAIPDDLKLGLFDAKKKLSVLPSPVDRATEAINRIAQIDPKVLDLAESHPNVTKAFLAAAKEGEKASTEPQGESAADTKGKTAKIDTASAPGTADVPRTPSGHALVQTSDGGLHHVPTKNLDKVKSIDPHATVLHIES